MRLASRQNWQAQGCHLDMRALSENTFSKKEIAMGIFAIKKNGLMRADGTPTLGELANSASAKTPDVFTDDSTSP